MTDTLTEHTFKQYYRQIMLSQIGERGQQAIMASHVLIIGIGGLGTHVAQQLAAAGVGHLYLFDDDTVDVTNLPRQILFTQNDMGKLKVSTAQKALENHSPSTRVVPIKKRFTHDTIEEVLNIIPELAKAQSEDKLIVLDCSDNITTRRASNQWCILQSIPLVSASISAFAGQALTVDMKNMREVGCYQCVFKTTEVEDNCATMGVLGPAVGMMASAQALMALKHIVGMTDDKLHLFDGLSMNWQHFSRQADPSCPVCLKRV